MKDPKDYIRELTLRDDYESCGAHVDKRVNRWFCLRPKDHEGHHAMVSMRVQGFTDEGKNAGSTKIESIVPLAFCKDDPV